MTLPACSDLRQAIGLDRAGPDEFAVESRAPLTIPPEFDLRPPQPGAPRPQDVTAAEKARQAIDSAGPGEPGKQASASGPGKSPDTAAGDPNLQAGNNPLAEKLLTSNDTNGDGTAETRQTETLKGVY